MSGTRIQPAGACDLAVLAELSRLCFAADDAAGFAGSPWSARSLGEVMALPGVFGLLALAGEQPVGFGLVQVVLEEAELLTLGVAPAARRAGHGRNLLQAALAEAARRGAARMTLEVAQHNRKGQALYSQAGFRPAGRRRNYYRSADGNPSDAIVLERALESAAPAGAGG